MPFRKLDFHPIIFTNEVVVKHLQKKKTSPCFDNDLAEVLQDRYQDFLEPHPKKSEKTTLHDTPKMEI